jgi:hypothetical protein
MPGAARRPLKVVTHIQVDKGAKSTVEASVDALDCIEVVAWRRLTSGAAVRYVCLSLLARVGTLSRRPACSQASRRVSRLGLMPIQTGKSLVPYRTLNSIGSRL